MQTITASHHELHRSCRVRSDEEYKEWFKTVNETVNIFIDHGYVSSGQQLPPSACKPHDPTVRINFRSFHERISGFRRVKSLVVSGTAPSAEACRKLECQWSKLMKTDLGYNKQSRSSIRFGETESHAHMADVAVDILRAHTEPQTIILITSGGGKDSASYLFAERALSCGWRVEAWAWKASIGQGYLDLSRDTDLMSIRYLDVIMEDVEFRSQQFNPTYAYRTRLCTSWEADGTCPKGDLCTYAHGEGQLVVTAPRRNAVPKLLHTRMCEYKKATGHCPHEDCWFAHSIDQMRENQRRCKMV